MEEVILGKVSAHPVRILETDCPLGESQLQGWGGLEEVNTKRLSVNYAPNNWASSPFLKEDLSNASLYLPLW